MIEIKDGKWIMSYKGMDTDPNSIYNFSVEKSKDSNEKVLTLTNDFDTMKYTIQQQSENTLSLIYLDRGNTLTYNRVQINLSPFTELPPGIEGCSCYYALDKDEFVKKNYIYVESYENYAFMNINDNKTQFKLDLTQHPAEDEVVQTWSSGNELTLVLLLVDVGQIDETNQKNGILKLKKGKETIFETDIYGECGC